MKGIRLLLILILFSQTILAKKIVEEVKIEDSQLAAQLTDTLATDSVFYEERPEETYEEVVYTPKQSVLHIPISINVSLLERKLNENFNGLLYEDDNIEDDSLMIRAWKENDFKIAYNQNILNYKIPVKIWIKKRFGLGFTHTDQEIEGTINMEMQTAINFSKDWGLITKTEMLQYNWIKKPVLKLGIIDIPITSIVDKILKNNKQLLNESVDETVKQYVPLQSYIQEIWESIQNPIDISTSGYKAWLKITPKNLYTTPIVGSQGQINTTIGVKCLSEIYMDVPPKAGQKETKMPRFQMYTNTDKQIKVNLLADVPYTTVDSIANDIMRNETFGEGRHTIIVDSMEIFGQKEKMMIGVHVHGFIKGAIYLEGIPYFEKSSTSIRIKDVEYKIKTKNVLAKIVNLFYKKGLKKMIEEKIIISLKDEIALIKDSSRNELFNKELMEDVYMNGMLNEVNVEDIFLTKTGLKIGIVLSGKINVRVE